MQKYVTVPADRITAVLNSTPVTESDIDVLRDPRQPWRYVGVYEERRVGAPSVYSARVHKFVDFGCHFRSPREAARVVAAWYKHQYGAHRWPRLYRSRKSAPWRIVNVKMRCVWSVADDAMEVVGHRAEVFVRGVPVVVTHALAGLPVSDRKRYQWPSRADAERAAKGYAAIAGQRDIVPGMVLWRG